MLWQQQKYELPEPDSHSSNGIEDKVFAEQKLYPRIEDKVFAEQKLYPRLLNYQEEELSFWKKRIVPNNSTQQHLSPSSLHLSIPIMGKEVQNVITSKKIRIYPQN